jgi:hypothetical protein
VADGTVQTDNGSLSLAAAHISLGETAGVSGGLVLSNDDLARLNARDLRLTSRGTIDIYGAIDLGLDHLELDSAGLAGYANSGKQVSINAETLMLANRAGTEFTAAPDGHGALDLTAREVSLGEGNFAVRGFDNVNITATEQIIGRPETAVPISLQAAGDLTLSASRLTATKGADISIGTQDASGIEAGKLTLDAPAVLAALAPVTDLGASLTLAGTEIDERGHIALPSGIVTLHATDTGGVAVASGATIDTAGRDVNFADTVVGSPGGEVRIVADQGDIGIAADASIDVSAATGGGDAGKLALLAAAGAVNVDQSAQLKGTASSGASQGRFAVDTRMLTG